MSNDEKKREELYAELQKLFDNAGAIIRWIEKLNPR